MTLRDLLGKSLSAQISCAVRGGVVRDLTLAGPYVDLRAADGTRAMIAADEPLVYEPWFMDRGSVLVRSSTHGLVKLCTELDLVKLEDGTVCALEFDGDTLRAEVCS